MSDLFGNHIVGFLTRRLISKSSGNSTGSIVTSCADPEIFMRGGPTKMVIFGHR